MAVRSEFLIASTHSGAGKTTLTLGILSAMKERCLKVQSFKAGPDFIDAGLHGLITGRPSVNLDLWMMGEDYVRWIFNKYSEGFDVVIVEGVMGLFDGGDSSTGVLARSLDLPVLLLIDTYGMAESLRPVVRGYLKEAEEREIKLMGLIFNRVGGEGHLRRLRESIKDLGIDIMGYLPKDNNFTIPSRHLGLYRAEDSPLSEGALRILTGAVRRFIDIDRLVELSKVKKERKVERPQLPLPSSITVAIARDQAFSFYYTDMIEGLKASGIKIVEFSPLKDSEIPPGVDLIYIGGGYPELYAQRLSENRSMIDSIKSWVFDDKPLYGECGGLMYLSRGIYINNAFFPMVGIFPFTVEMKKTPVLGYRLVENNGRFYRGHEFHYSEISVIEEQKEREIKRIFRLFSREGDYLGDEGFLFKRTLSTYVHIHNLSWIIKGLMEDSWNQ